MASPADINVEALLGGMDAETLMAFADNDFEAIFERLQEPFDDLEQRIVVSSMVQEAVSKGFLKAIEEESHAQLAGKDMEIASLQELLKAKDGCIHDLQKVLGIAEAEASSVGNAEHTRSRQLWDFLQESQKKWEQCEVAIAANEREIERFASNMACLTLMLDNESRRAATLEKQLSDIKEQDAIKSSQISSFQQDIVKLKLDKSSLNRQARLKRLQFDESMEHTRTELQQMRVHSENILQDKRLLEKTLEGRDRDFSKLESEYRVLKSQMHILDDELKKLSERESTLRETIEEQVVMHQCERELLMTCIHKQLKESYLEFKKDSKLMPSSYAHKDVEEKQVSSWIKGGPQTTEMVNDMTELTWKINAEALIVGSVVDGWHKEIAEVLHKLTYELAWKDEEIFFRDGQLGSLKQAVEELENDYATLMSICLTLIRDQNDNDSRGDSTSPSIHELGRQKLIELSEFLSSRDAIGGGQEEKDSLVTEFQEELSGQRFLQDLKPEIVSEVFREELALEGIDSRDFSGEWEEEPSLQLNLASAQLQHTLELEMLCEVFSNKYKEAVDFFLESKISQNGFVESIDNKISDNFEELGADFESFMELQACKKELEACRLEKMGCSSSIAKCEFKLDKLMKNLSDQVNKMNAKISLMQDAIKLQEWKYMFEEDILTLLIRDALADLQRNLRLDHSSQSSQVEHVKASECHKNPMDMIITSTSPRDVLLLLEKEGQRLDNSQQGVKDKEKMIALLRKGIEELRKDKAECEQRLEEITEELYSLKRQFWKEREIWTSKLSQRQKKEVEVQVNALARHSSTAVDLEEQFKRLEETRFDALASSLREEWLTEKENLKTTVSQNEAKIESLGGEIVRLREKERDGKATEAGLLASIAELKIQIDNLSSSKLSEEFQFANCKQDWQNEKEFMKKEVDTLIEKNRTHAASQACITARSTELENQIQRLSAQMADLNAEKSKLRQALLDQEAEQLKLREHYEKEKESYRKLTLEKNELMDKIVAFSEQEKSSANLIEELKAERATLTKEALDRSSESQLTAEKEIAKAVKDKAEEEQKRKVLELQLQDLRNEVKDLQDFNGKTTQLESCVEALPRQLELEVAQQVETLVKASNCFEQSILQRMQENSVRLDEIKEKCKISRFYSKKLPVMEAQQRQRLAKELVNLQKAEAEVDLLGDEVDSLLDILEEVHDTFDHYAPVIVHYPKMKEVARIVKQEIQLRIDPKYGA